MNPAAFDRRAIPAEAAESCWMAADGHAIRRIDWPGAGETPRGSILFFPGRGDNYEKYLETLHHWHEQGWRVTAADWRGQAGSGRLGQDAVTGHVDDFGDWIDDLAEFWPRWRAETPGPHVLAGHSMGGHLVLRGVVEKRVDPDGIMLSAPMLGYYGTFLPVGVMRKVAGLIRRFGHPARPAWKWSEKPGEIPVGRINLLTHDKDRYEDELWWREKRPELVMGPGSWGWVEQGYASMQVIFAPGALEAVTIPTLILATSNDKLVDAKAIERAAARLPNCKLVRFGKEAHHEILREVDEVRDRAIGEMDAFLATLERRD
ncbi:alpha/beta fold hydrolase [Erythrobacter sp. HKB08]|uniref:alpha/beta fold hydrolase n=1 Tax=Erythrobacter sp. HKB08 TaxID=2502843 RepID=UPI001F386EE8|nr:alpha/beta hydrolase [Erythrobacter sp. HKB08]